MGVGAAACTPARVCLKSLVFVLPFTYVQADPLAPCRLMDQTEMVAVVEVTDHPHHGTGTYGHMVGGGMDIVNQQEGLDALQSGILFVTGVDPRRRSKPLEPHCVFRIRADTGRTSTFHVFRLELSDLSDHEAGYWRGRKPERNGFFVLREELGSWDGWDPLVDLEWIQEGVPVVADRNRAKGELEGGATAVGTAGDENHYLAVATSPPAGWHIEAGESGHFGIGWHSESHHDAGMNAARECREHGGGSACSFNASGTSLRGGCVGLAIASWRDRDKEPERTYVVTSSSFRDLIARDLRAGCDSTAFSGKHEDTVVEHSCEIVRIMCAGDTIPVGGNPER